MPHVHDAFDSADRENTYTHTHRRRIYRKTNIPIHMHGIFNDKHILEPVLQKQTKNKKQKNHLNNGRYSLFSSFFMFLNYKSHVSSESLFCVFFFSLNPVPNLSLVESAQ